MRIQNKKRQQALLALERQDAMLPKTYYTPEVTFRQAESERNERLRAVRWRKREESQNAYALMNQTAKECGT